MPSKANLITRDKKFIIEKQDDGTWSAKELLGEFGVYYVATGCPFREDAKNAALKYAYPDAKPERVKQNV